MGCASTSPRFVTRLATGLRKRHELPGATPEQARVLWNFIEAAAEGTARARVATTCGLGMSHDEIR